MYTSDPATKKLKCTYGASKELFTVIVSQDTCYSESGKPFSRIFIDNILDERFYALPYKIEQMKQSSPVGFSKNPPFRKYRSAEEHDFFLEFSREAHKIMKNCIVLWIIFSGM